jgi:hypothetical protein
MKTMTWFGLVIWLAVPALPGSAQAPQAAAPGAPEKAPAVPASLSPGAAEVVKLATSGVGDEVVLAYITNSQALFDLSANDVLYLKDLGLSPEVTTAMLNHDSMLRSQAPPTAPAPAAPAPAPAAPAAPPAYAPVPDATATVATAPAPVYVSTPPPDVTYFYNDLAPYGTWVQLDGYGWCWQPTAVVLTAGWRPYSHGGHWVYCDLGWYWQSTYSWGWAPFHYGRWHHHQRCGWVWTPDRVWGPAWVTWRTVGDTCGWAPLPPHSTFDVRLGWCYNNVAVGANFGFNLGSDAFLFVSFGNVCQPNVYRHCLPPARVATVYNQTTIINNYVVNNNRIEHRGIPVDRVSAVSQRPVPRATVREWSDRPDRMPTRASSVVYRPRLDAPARPARMEAQRIDAQHPVIQHTPSGPPRVERAAAPGRSASAFTAAPRRQTLESPKVAPWSSSASAPQTKPATASGQAAPTSIWSRDAKPASTPQVQPTPRAPQTRPATPSGKAPTTSSRSSDSRTALSPQIQSTPRAPQPTPATPAGRASQTASSSRETKLAASSQTQPTLAAPQSVPTIPPAATLPRAPENWKQGTRAAPGYRSDAGLPALYNNREAGQPSSAASQAGSQSANTHVYPPKSARQAAEIRPVPSPNTRSVDSSPSRSAGSDSRSRKDK